MAKREILYRTSNPIGQWTSLTSVLSMDLWMAIFISMLIFLMIFTITTKIGDQKKFLLTSIIDSESIILRAFLAQSFDENQFTRSHFGSRKIIAFQLQILSFLGAIVFWTYSGCLISFFTFSDSGPPIHSLSELPSKPYVRLSAIGPGTTFNSIKSWLEENHGVEGLLAFNQTIVPFDDLQTVISEMVQNEPQSHIGLISESQSITGQIRKSKLS